MKKYKDKKLFLKLLSETKLFDKKGQTVIKQALGVDVLPEVDFNYLLFVLKTENNLHYLVDKRTDKLLAELKKKPKKN